MAVTIDARGLACPGPVIKTKKALDKDKDITVLVDNKTALENVSRLAVKMKCSVEQGKDSDGTYRIVISKTGDSVQVSDDDSLLTSCSVAGKTVALITSDKMGKGDDELGEILMKAFMHTLQEISPLPDTVILYNAGVKLAVNGTQTSEDLDAMSKNGVDILVCGTCINFFELAEAISIGTVSNMYDITDTLFNAGKIVSP